ncbi:MAG TPA: DNA-processing protein DprA [Solirubrobacteraceae bacterium]|nr:DNA-processing protein DprA [Solirubrobacteraceae bacterium]
MSEPRAPSACHACLRRSWLLARLSASLDYRCTNVPRLADALALDDEQLFAALAGSRRAAVRSEFLSFDAAQVAPGAGVDTLCRHDRSYPTPLLDAGAPPMLNISGSAARLRELTSGPAVAILGTCRASDYGLEVARSIARGLAAAGIVVVVGLTDGVATAALAGVLEARGAALAVVGRGLGIPHPRGHRLLIERLCDSGCILSELPSNSDGRRWGPVAAERIVVRLAELAMVVEADDSTRELAGAHLARALDRRVAAVPGRISSRASRGTNELLREGARLVRGPEDVLELLGADGGTGPAHATAACPRLEPRLAELLEQVGEGRDRPDELIRAGRDAGDVLLALSELELMGLLRRGDGGRYLPVRLP